MSFVSARASSAKGKHFLGDTLPTQSNVNGPPPGFATGPERKLDGIPESRKSLTLRAPTLVSTAYVSRFVARIIALDFAVLWSDGDSGNSRTRTSRTNSRPER
jgi:hypothetical protein